MSSLTKSEDFGGIYRKESGRRGDALAILKDHGLNWIRVRVWVDPADGYHDTAELLSMAKRAKRLGLKMLVNLHYSDFWADPGKQWTPDAWQGQTFDELKTTFTDYTRGIVQSLVDQGTPPDMIQLGNEINPGMLWDYAATWTGDSTADDGTGVPLTVHHTENWPNLAALLTAGYDAVKAVSPKTRVMLHLAEGGSNGTFRWWFDNVTSRNVPFDVIGASYYGYWHGSLARAPVQPGRRHGPLPEGHHRRRDRLCLHPRRRRQLGKHHRRSQPARARLSGHAGRPGAELPRRDEHRPRRPERPGPRRLLLGSHVDRRRRQRLEPSRPELWKRMGEPGALRLRRSAAPGDE